MRHTTLYYLSVPTGLLASFTQGIYPRHVMTLTYMLLATLGFRFHY
jgi:hypothetical protein